MSGRSDYFTASTRRACGALPVSLVIVLGVMPTMVLARTIGRGSVKTGRAPGGTG